MTLTRYSYTIGSFITALHGMQTWSSDDKAVRPSVCMSNAWYVTKRKENLSRFFYHMEDHFSLVF